VLDLGGVPLLSTDRERDASGAGRGAYGFNRSRCPTFLMPPHRDGEDAFLEIAEMFIALRRSGATRQDM